MALAGSCESEGQCSAASTSSYVKVVQERRFARSLTATRPLVVDIGTLAGSSAAPDASATRPAAGVPNNSAAAPATAGLAAVPNVAFRIPPDEVQRLLAEKRCNLDQLLQHLITPASALARTPISSFQVGAVGVGGSGSVYLGVNLEFARLPLFNSVHAEQFLLVNAKHHGEESIGQIAVSAAPCGHCRQFYSETCCAAQLRFTFGQPPACYSLDDLLPHRFGPEDLLGDSGAPLLLQPQRNGVRLTAAAAALVAERSGRGQEEVEGAGGSGSVKEEEAGGSGSGREDGGGGGGGFAQAARQALEEAGESYAPYSRCPAGLALITSGGDVYSGGYIESAAYNPSLPPLQAAVVDAVIDGMPAYTEVLEVVLAEIPGAPVSHACTTQIILQQIAPSARLTVLDIERC